MKLPLELHFSFYYVMATSPKYIQPDRQWDARFNVPEQEDLDRLLQAIDALVTQAQFSYVLVSGVEVGTAPYRDDYMMKHVHCCLVFTNRKTKTAILKNLMIKPGLGYYLVPRNRELPVEGWIEHHKKAETKVDPKKPVLLELGTPPKNKVDATGVIKRSDEEKKRKIDECIIDMKALIEEGNDRLAFTKFPRYYLQWGEKIKSMLVQEAPKTSRTGDPNIWLFGYPGQGKTALMNYVYPRAFNKNLDNKFFDLLDNNHHTHVLLSDLSPDVIEKQGIQFLKALCDESGYPIDQKYKAPQPISKPVIVTSNFTIDGVIPEDMVGRNMTKLALMRRFFYVDIVELLRHLNLKIIPKIELNQLKASGNKDPGAVFYDWSYIRNCPTGTPIRDPSYYADRIKALYYGIEPVPKETTPASISVEIPPTVEQVPKEEVVEQKDV